MSERPDYVLIDGHFFFIPGMTQTPATCGAVRPRDARTSSAPSSARGVIPSAPRAETKQARPSPGG